jgi:hypothetical protein
LQAVLVRHDGRMARTTNPTLWARFDRGEAVSAIEGSGEYFIGSVTDRDRHDETLVLRQLAYWADEREKWPEPLAAVEKAIDLAVADGEVPKALGIGWAAMLVENGTHEALLTGRATEIIRDLAARDGLETEAEAVALCIRERLGDHSQD